MFGSIGWNSLFGSNRLTKVLCGGLNQYNALLNVTRHFETGLVLHRRPGILYPQGVSKMWAVNKIIDISQYTVDALPLVRTGGRGPDGRIQLKHVTKGLRRPWFMVDYNYSRHLETGKVREEIILQIKKNWWRHPFIALVASGEVKRWILATTTMKVNDVIRQHCSIPTIPVEVKEGDAYLVGALPVGTIINQIELKPGEGAVRCRSAGSSATVIRRGKHVGEKSLAELKALMKANVEFDDDDVVVIRDNSNRKLLRLIPFCMVVAGRVSNERHSEFKFKKFGEKYWRGIKQRSGLWQRKTGRFGRKIKPVTSSDFVVRPASQRTFSFSCSYADQSAINRKKKTEIFDQMKPYVKQKYGTPKNFNDLEHNQAKFTWCSWSSVR